MKEPARGTQIRGKARVQTWVWEPLKPTRDNMRRLLRSPGSMLCDRSSSSPFTLLLLCIWEILVATRGSTDPFLSSGT